MLTALLQTLPLHDLRATLKALMGELDQVQQVFFAQRQAGMNVQERPQPS